LTPSSGRTTAGVVVAATLASTLLAPPLLFPLAFATVAAAADDAGECSEPGACVEEGEGGDGAVIPEYAAAYAEAKGEVDAGGGVGGGGADEFPTRHATNGDRLITKEELALHTTAQDRIWLSILGRVYNVTDGDGFYGALKGEEDGGEDCREGSEEARLFECQKMMLRPIDKIHNIPFNQYDFIP